jgi:hypothetical protein
MFGSAEHVLAGPSTLNLLHSSMAPNPTPAIPDVRVLI